MNAKCSREQLGQMTSTDKQIEHKPDIRGSVHVMHYHRMCLLVFLFLHLCLFASGYLNDTGIFFAKSADFNNRILLSIQNSQANSDGTTTTKAILKISCVLPVSTTTYTLPSTKESASFDWIAHFRSISTHVLIVDQQNNNPTNIVKVFVSVPSAVSGHTYTFPSDKTTTLGAVLSLVKVVCNGTFDPDASVCTESLYVATVRVGALSSVMFNEDYSVPLVVGMVVLCAVAAMSCAVLCPIVWCKRPSQERDELFAPDDDTDTLQRTVGPTSSE